MVAIVREENASDELLRVQQWAREHGVTVVKVIGTDLASLGRAIDEVQADTTGTAGLVVEHEQLLGDVVRQEVVRAVLERAGGTLHVMNPIPMKDVTPTRELVAATTRVMTDLQNQVYAARLSRGATRRRKLSGRSGGRAPFGKKFVDGELVEDAREEAVKRRMQQLRADGLGYSAIARRVEVEGYLKRDGSTDWHPDMVRRILLREAS